MSIESFAEAARVRWPGQSTTEPGGSGLLLLRVTYPDAAEARNLAARAGLTLTETRYRATLAGPDREPVARISVTTTSTPPLHLPAAVADTAFDLDQQLRAGDTVLTRRYTHTGRPAVTSLDDIRRGGGSTRWALAVSDIARTAIARQHTGPLGSPLPASREAETLAALLLDHDRAQPLDPVNLRSHEPAVRHAEHLLANTELLAAAVALT